MKIKPLKHCRLSQMKFFYWDPKDDPREPEYWEDSPSGGSFLCVKIFFSLNIKDGDILQSWHLEEPLTILKLV